MHSTPSRLLFLRRTRLWGVEEMAKRFLRGEATDEHRQMLAVIQTVNADQTDNKSTIAPGPR